MRRDGRFECVRIAVGISRRRIARRDQRLGILVAQAVRGAAAAAGDGLHAACTQTARAQRMQQRDGRMRLADAGVGAGDEVSVHRGRLRGNRGAVVAAGA